MISRIQNKSFCLHNIYTCVYCVNLCIYKYTHMHVRIYTLRNKGTKAVTGAVSFQKVHVCTLRVHFGTLKVHIST